MSFVGLFVWSFVTTIGAVMSPGPVSTAVVTEGMRRGLRVGPLVSIGHTFAELVVVVALATGIGRVLERPMWATAIGLLGGIFLLWMGGTMAWGAARREVRLPRAGDDTVPGAGSSLIVLGVVTTLSNPFWYMWWVSVGGGYVLMTLQEGVSSLLVFYLGHISADYVWNTILASVVASGRSWLNDRVYQALLLVCGLFLVYLGLRFMWTGVGLVVG